MIARCGIAPRSIVRLGISMAELKIASLRPEAGRNAPARNEACALDLGWVRDVRVNLSAAERRVATLPGRRTVKKDAQAAWLLKAVTCIDLTTLNGDDTEGRVRRLCAKAKSPIRHDILEALGMADRPHHHRRDLRLPSLRQDRGGRAGRQRHSGRRRLHRLPRRPGAARCEAEGDRGLGARRRQGDRHRHHPRACADRQLAGAL
jgi:hypothetical protein